MYRLLGSSALLFLLLLGVSTKFIQEDLDCGPMAGGGGGGQKVKNDSYNKFPEPPECGNSRFKSRIVGGIEVREAEFPWMVAVSTGFGGSLLNARWFVTTAAAFYNKEVKDIVAYVGTLYCDDIYKDRHFDVRKCETHPLEISKAFAHEQYQTEWPNQNDIALGQLKERLAFSNVISPICLAYKGELSVHDVVGLEGVVSGWGRTEDGVNSKSLLKVNMLIWAPSRCENEDIKPNYHICSGGEIGKSSCYGDSGGSMALRLPPGETYYLLGTDSSGFCGLHLPIYSTNVTTFLPWIRKILLEND